ncbi:MAG: hypothetical protein IKE91_04245 [Clostridia bacterium]|nr:hypothetical protein [Clostridia bacterium]
MDSTKDTGKYVFVLTFRMTATKRKLIGENEECSINHVYGYHTTEPIMTLSEFKEVMNEVIDETKKQGFSDVTEPILVNSFCLIDDE